MASKKEKQYLGRVAEIGCIVCRYEGLGRTPAEIHHIRSGQGVAMRASHYDVLPLCPHHHRSGGHGEAFHAGKEVWESKFGTEVDLLKRVRAIISRIYG